jgi:hypothetical protein
MFGVMVVGWLIPIIISIWTDDRAWDKILCAVLLSCVTAQIAGILTYIWWVHDQGGAYVK